MIPIRQSRSWSSQFVSDIIISIYIITFEWKNKVYRTLRERIRGIKQRRVIFDDEEIAILNIRNSTMFSNLPLAIIFLIAHNAAAQESCHTPSKKPGICINLKNCSALFDILIREKPLSESSLNLLRKSQCGFEGKDPKVCCEFQGTTITETPTRVPEPPSFIPNPPDLTNHINLRLLDLHSCGPITEQKIFGGNKTGVLQYPWMALIAFRTGSPTPEFRCGGSIINKRYILTAAHCVTELPTGFTVIGARVGDHDTSKERDCDYDKNGLEIVCAERYQDFGVESIHYHPMYTRTKLQNDIALIRLDNDIDFRPANARPICLPLSPATKITQKKVTVTGWGITENRTASNVLLQVRLSIVPNEECAATYKNFAQVEYKQMCAGGKNGMDSCLGDSGGPLQSVTLYNEKDARFVQFGIVSFGLKICGTEGYPGVYTRVAYFTDWILNTIKD